VVDPVAGDEGMGDQADAALAEVAVDVDADEVVVVDDVADDGAVGGAGDVDAMAVVAVAVGAGAADGVVLDEDVFGVVGEDAEAIVEVGDGVANDLVEIPIGLDAGALVGISGDVAAALDGEADDVDVIATGFEVDAGVGVGDAGVDDDGAGGGGGIGLEGDG